MTFLPGGAFGNTLTVHEMVVLPHDNPLVGLRNLDLPNLIIIPCGMILFLCLYGAHRHVNKPGADLALLLYLAGSLFMFIKIPALTMLSLSGQYATAPNPKSGAGGRGKPCNGLVHGIFTGRSGGNTHLRGDAQGKPLYRPGAVCVWAALLVMPGIEFLTAARSTWKRQAGSGAIPASGKHASCEDASVMVWCTS